MIPVKPPQPPFPLHLIPEANPRTHEAIHYGFDVAPFPLHLIPEVNPRLSIELQLHPPAQSAFHSVIKQ